MVERGIAPHASGRSAPDLMAELEALRAEVRARNPDLTAEQAAQIADQITREAIDAMVGRGEIAFERDQPTR